MTIAELVQTVTDLQAKVDTILKTRAAHAADTTTEPTPTEPPSRPELLRRWASIADPEQRRAYYDANREALLGIERKPVKTTPPPEYSKLVADGKHVEAAKFYAANREKFNHRA